MIVAGSRGYRIASFPPPSSGGVHVAQLLNILETRDLHAFKPGSADLIHFVAEAMKLAFADRAYWLGDPDFASVPRGLIDKKYARKLASKIDPKRGNEITKYFVQVSGEALLFFQAEKKTKEAEEVERIRQAAGVKSR